jgi:hypothetical protein
MAGNIVNHKLGITFLLNNEPMHKMTTNWQKPEQMNLHSIDKAEFEAELLDKVQDLNDFGSDAKTSRELIKLRTN